MFIPVSSLNLSIQCHLVWGLDSFTSQIMYVSAPLGGALTHLYG